MTRRALALVACLAGCERACGSAVPPEPSVASRPAPPPSPPLPRDPRCAAEAAHPAVATAPGAGAIDAIVPTCADGTLALFVVRGHILSRLSRGTAAGSGWSVETWATGVDRLGPVASGGVRGPVAWRSPLAGLEPDERDDVWAAEAVAGDGGWVIRRGDALLPAGVEGLGVPVVVGSSGAGVTLLAGVGRAGEAPFAARLEVALGRDAPSEPRALPAALRGDLKAWEATRGVALARVDDAAGRWLEATWPGGAQARHRLASSHALVAARGVAVGGRSAFLVGAFERGEVDGGRCLRVGEGMCVRATGLFALLAGAPGEPLEQVAIAEAGLPDAVAAAGDALWALYLAPEPAADGAVAPAQRAARVDVPRRAVTPLPLEAPPGLGAIDGPTLVRCDDGVWLAAELAAEDGSVPKGRVTALPLGCFTR